MAAGRVTKAGSYVEQGGTGGQQVTKAGFYVELAQAFAKVTVAGFYVESIIDLNYVEQSVFVQCMS